MEAWLRAEARIAKVEADIKDISNSVVPGSGGRFIRLLRNRFRSSGFSFDYRLERDGLLVRLGEIAAAKRKRAIEEVRQLSAVSIANRDRRMAEEFLRKRKTSSDSDTALMVAIGKRHEVKRSAAIEAINRGLKALKP